ncbi:kinase-like domain-containing protein [Dichotomopilus funicola]|uniref:Kinase-like domain-containing protein n=1 Tax=Dichotomopilus funicola TaxID=1934379 RepID=A0AAN6V1E6_9PEZI|nr:kinase-like domain-containing protein [Dichotomopilus funicola]
MAGRVRQPIDVGALERWIAKNVPRIEVPLDVKQFGFGQSNPTYQLTAADGQRYVLRKKPPGRLLSKTAHKVEREYRIIHALEHTDVPVPRAYCLCEDTAVLGTAFYIMEFLDGRIFEDPIIPSVLPEHRLAIWTDAVRTLAKLHRIDPRAIGLEAFGKPTGFYNRQVATWRSVCDAQAAVRDVETRVAVGPLPHFADLMAFFADENQQPADRGTLIHGDFKIDNLVFHKTEPRVIGILDWEMSTIGHPLSDISNLLTPYFTARLDPRRSVNVHPGFRPRATRGLPTPDEITSLYFTVASLPSPTSPRPSSSLELTLHRHNHNHHDDDHIHHSSGGRSTNISPERRRELQWAQAFNIFRLAAICQGIAARQAGRQASSEQARRYGDARGPLAEFAWQLVQSARSEGRSASGSGSGVRGDVGRRGDERGEDEGGDGEEERKREDGEKSKL